MKRSTRQRTELWDGREGRGWWSHNMKFSLTFPFSIGWARFMEWKYPVEVVVTSKKSFKLAGAIEAAASL